MEDVLEVYHLPYNPNRPVVNMDEQPNQLIKETRLPIAASSGHPLRYDFEYERNGTAEIFLFTEPLARWRKVNVREHRTKIDWAQEIKILLDVDYPGAEKIILVCDNLNTHNIGALYEAFKPAEARRLARRLEIHHTPKHGSWLNIAETELSVLTRQSLDYRIADIKTLGKVTQQWWRNRNTNQKGVDWQFTTEDARIRLKHLYPQIQML